MKRVLNMALIAMTVILVPTMALAEGEAAPMPGKALWDWISSNILGAFPVILAGVSLYYLIKRAFAAFIGFAVFAALVAVFVFSPDTIKSFGLRMGSLLLK